MSTAMAPRMPLAHGFRRSEKGKAVLEEEEERDRNGFFGDEEAEEEEELRAGRDLEHLEALSESSSIGAASSDSSSIGEDSASEDGEEEVESKAVEEALGMGLGTLESLEDALPTKRGLSDFYAGKSKSFTSLAEAAAKAAAKEIAKPENPFNKRRRVLAAWSRRRASCSALATTYLPPLLSMDHTVVEEDEEEERSDDEAEQQQQRCDSNGGKNDRREKNVPSFPPPRLTLQHSQKGIMMRSPNAANSFRSPRSFSLSDLQSASYN